MWTDSYISYNRTPMMITAVLFCLLGFAVSQLVIPDTTLIRYVVDGGFGIFDKYPKDGAITHQELDNGMFVYDSNNDGCVSEKEFEHVNNLPIPHLAATFFDHFDKDHNDCINVTDLAEAWRQMDTSGDDSVSLPEFEAYFIKLISSIVDELFPIGGITGLFSVVCILVIASVDAGQMCASCIGTDGNEPCTFITECADNEKCYMHSYKTDFVEVASSEYFDYGCTTGQACPSSLDYIIGKRDGHHLICSACCNDTRLCNLNLSCDQLPDPGTSLPRDCSDLYIPNTKSGIHTIYPFNVPHRPVPVYCMFDSNNDVWTVFQRRIDGSVDFQQNWSKYKSGFGSAVGEYWLGNDALHEITSHGAHSLKIVMTDFNDTMKYAEYDSFRVADEAHLYRITVYGYNGTAGDSFSVDGFKFSTIDKDHDTYAGNCAVAYRGGWWYGACHASNLNGLYLKGDHSSYANGIEWYTWRGHYYSLKTTMMMTRRV